MHNASTENNPKRNRLHILFIAATTITSILVSLYYLFSGTFIIFQNLFYVPIVLSCIYYTMRGFIYSVSLAVLYLLLVLFFTSEIAIIMQALARVGLFIAIAGTITLLSVRFSRTQEALRESEEKYRAAFITSPDAVNINTMDGRYVDINEGFTRLTGFTQEDVLGIKSSQLGIWVIPEDRTRLVEGLQETGVVENLESVFRCKDGSVKTALMSARIIKIGNVPHILSITRDITDRKQAEEELRHKEVFLRQSEGIARVGGWKANPETDYLVWTEGVYDIVEAPLDYRPGFREALKFFAPEYVPLIKESLLCAINDGTPFSLEVEVITTTGKRLWTEVRGLSRMQENNRVSAVGTLQDITSRKQSEELVKASLKEKEVLLREVHHRVKNNMQVISSLLNMQSRNLTEAKVVTMFEASINRIKSMAFVHDKLYQTEGLSRISVRDYIEQLSGHLLSTYSVGSNISLDINVDPLTLGIDTVMPLGILINELVTNSLKHAFPEKGPGKIGISLKNDNGHGLVLTVSDNGIGFPADLDHMDTQSMGMQLVVTLVEQLDGTMELNRSNGTEFRIIFRGDREL